MTQRKLHCAVYTRKSTEEGLDQAFNSLDAQREACRAYVLSQAGEGWTAIPTRYDDGGFSGGDMDRPALQRLLEDTDKDRVDIIVVYKIDRLTRSLADFAKIVERFEKRNVSFVSVTQAFNTTTSMGRLTLNVLLSFAQFEREVTAERIRDKFSASRKRGIFMGGNPPLGYDARARKLVINASEAETVRYIFRRYIELGSVSQLRAELDVVRTKSWVSTRGRAMGGGEWYIGPLRHILRNRVYVGDAMHKGTAHPGEHQPIIPRDLFDAVQVKLDANRASHHRKRTVGSQGLLTGLIFDDRGNVMSPSKSRRPDGRCYLYYVSQGHLQRRDPDAMRPVPAPAIEDIVRDRLRRIVRIGEQIGTESSTERVGTLNESQLRDLTRELIARIEVGVERTAITFNALAISNCIGIRSKQIGKALRTRLPSEDSLDVSAEHLVLTIPVRLRLRGGIKRVEGWDRRDWTTGTRHHNANLIKALAQAHEWREWIETGEVVTLEDLAARTHHDRKHVRQILKLAFLAPDIQRAILAGQQPNSFTLAAIAEVDLPLLWADQRSLLGFAAAP